MHDPAARNHPVDRTRLDRLDRPQTVAVKDLAVEEIGHGSETDMRMRTHIEARSGW
jgi:hypothetical protein